MRHVSIVPTRRKLGFCALCDNEIDSNSPSYCTFHFRRQTGEKTVEGSASNALTKINASQISKFWSLVDKSGGPNACWPWKGKSVDKSGYGRYALFGRSLAASRVALHLKSPLYRSDIYACHRCDNRLCCNPSHLFPGDRFANEEDRKEKGKILREISRELFSTYTVDEIRILIAKGYCVSLTGPSAIALDSNGLGREPAVRVLFSGHGPIQDTRIPPLRSPSTGSRT